MNPSKSEEDLETTSEPDTSTVTTVTYTSTPSVTQVSSSTSYVPIDLSTHPPRYPPVFSYNSSGYQRNFQIIKSALLILIDLIARTCLQK